MNRRSALPGGVVADIQYMKCPAGVSMERLHRRGRAPGIGLGFRGTDGGAWERLSTFRTFWNVSESFPGSEADVPLEA